MTPITVTYYSDVLCIWAYVAQARVDAIRRTFPDEVRLDYRFVSVFGDTRLKLGEGWRDRDGFAGYARHVAGIARRFEHIQLDPRVWVEVQPASSLSPHLFLSAVLEWERTQLPAAVEREPQIFASVMWALRRGFFAEGLDISRRGVQRDLARPFGIDLVAVDALIDEVNASDDDAEVTRLLTEIDQKVWADAYGVPLYAYPTLTAVSASVSGVTRSPLGRGVFWDAWTWAPAAETAAPR